MERYRVREVDLAVFDSLPSDEHPAKVYVTQYDIPLAFNRGSNTAGFYAPSIDYVYIAFRALVTYNESIAVVLHELGHARQHKQKTRALYRYGANVAMIPFYLVGYYTYQKSMFLIESEIDAWVFAVKAAKSWTLEAHRIMLKSLHSYIDAEPGGMQGLTAHQQKMYTRLMMASCSRAGLLF